MFLSLFRDINIFRLYAIIRPTIDVEQQEVFGYDSDVMIYLFDEVDLMIQKYLIA